MKLKVNVSKKPKDGVVSVKKVKVREKLMTKLFGPIRTITVLVPGDTVSKIAIEEENDARTTRDPISKC